MYRVITVPGIGEEVSPDGYPIGMLKLFYDALPSDRFLGDHFNWRNVYGPVPVWNGSAYDDNLAAGVTDLKTRIANSPEPVVLAGYSGGAHLASLAAVGAENLAGIVIVSGPSRRAGDSNSPFYGITGQHEPYPDVPFWDVANPADVICCCPPDQPLRDFADISRGFSLADPVAWGQAMYAAILGGKTQGAFRHAKLWDWWQAVAYARGYLFDGQHTQWYVPRMPEVAALVASRLA